MSDPRVEAAKDQSAIALAINAMEESVREHPKRGGFGEAPERLRAIAERLDAVSSQYEAVAIRLLGEGEKMVGEPYLHEPNEHCTTAGCTILFRRIECADTRALIDNRTPAETAEAKAWSDDAHARIRAGEVSGSHDLMREKVGEYRADAQEAE